MAVWIISGFGICGVVFLLWVLWQMRHDGESHKRGPLYIRLKTIRREQDEDFDESRPEPTDSKAA